MRHVVSPTNDAYSRVNFITWRTLERIERGEERGSIIFKFLPGLSFNTTASYFSAR